MIFKRFVSLLFIFLSTTYIALSDEYTITKLSTKDGLSQNDIQQVMQDSYGYIWCVTNDGICRYDGYNFHNYSIGDCGLDDNIIYAVVEGKGGNMWFGSSGGGLYYYNRSENKFYHHTQLSTKEEWIPNVASIKYMTIADDGSIWAYNSYSKELIHFSFDYENNSVYDVSTYDYFKIHNDRFITELIVKDDILYAGTSKGLYRYSPKDDDIINCNDALFGYIISMKVKENKLFIGYNNSIKSLDLTSGKISEHANLESISNICWVGNDLWVSTRTKLLSMPYNSENNKFGAPKTVVNHKYDQISRSMIVDNVGTVWVSYRQIGLCSYEKVKKSINYYRGLGNNHIYPMYLDTKNNLWVGTFGGGLFLSNLENTNSFKRYALGGEIVYSIIQMPYNKKYYVATNKCVYEVDSPTSNSFKTLIPNQTGVGNVIADDNFLWVSTFGNGIIRYDVSTSEQIHIKVEDGLPSNIVRDQLIDSRGNLWLCTERGLALIDKDKRKLEAPVARLIQKEKTHKHIIIDITEDHNGNIWYGTNGRGVYCLIQNKTSYRVKEFNKINGLPDNVIKSILCTKRGEIWLATKKGICSVDPQTYNVRNLHISQTEYGYEFNEQSALELRDGVLLFGGVNGITEVTIDNIDSDKSSPIPIISDIKVFNESVWDSSEEYKKLIPTLSNIKRGITLKHNQNKLTFTLSALNFTNSKRYRYRYFLKGLDKDVIEVSAENREAIYTNILPGNYTFIAEVSNGDGVWSKSVLELPIRIKPPFWLAWYAFLMYIFIIIAGAVAVARYYKRRVHRKNENRLAIIEKQRMQEMMEVRTRLFSNISHEFRTPLTLILSPIQQILADKELANNPKLIKPLSVMYNNGNSLMRLISELLNYTKQESGNLKVELQYNNFARMSLKLIEQFRYWADNKGIKLEYNMVNSDINFYYDKHLMEQIIYNLISNAIKHTPEGGTVKYSFKEQENSVLISVSDTGVGIDDTIGAQLFERYYSLNANTNSEVGGTGIGLALSKSLVELHNGKIWYNSVIGEGTTFYILIPMQQIADEKVNSIDLAQVSKAESQINSDKNEIAESKNREEVEYPQNVDIDTDQSYKPTMLIVDDNRDMLILLSELFNKYYNILTAYDGEEGINKASEHIPDIIISDVMMPKVSGIELCNKLKNSENTSHIPIVLLTAKATSEKDVIEGYGARADAYCTKPFTNALLIERTNAIFENRRKVAGRILNSSQNGAELESDTTTNANEAVVEDYTTQIDKKFISKITEFIEENINNSELSVGDLCDKMGVTQLILNKKLRSLLNLTANALIRSIRIKHAAALLRTGRYTVADVTYDVGFSDLRYFRESFKKEFGLSPQAYKDKYVKASTEEEDD